MLLFLVATALAGQPSKRPSDAERGKQLYQRHCVQCHGVRNRGDGPATAALVFDVPDLEGKTETKGPHVTSVMQGKNAMPGFQAVFNDADAVRVLKFMAKLGADRSLKPPSAQPPPAKKATTVAEARKAAALQKAGAPAPARKDEVDSDAPDGPDSDE